MVDETSSIGSPGKSVTCDGVPPSLFSMYLRGRISRHRRFRAVIIHYVYGLMIAEKFCCTYSRKDLAQNVGQISLYLVLWIPQHLFVPALLQLYHLQYLSRQFKTTLIINLQKL